MAGFLIFGLPEFGKPVPRGALRGVSNLLATCVLDRETGLRRRDIMLVQRFRNLSHRPALLS